jgi:hypothetical protein
LFEQEELVFGDSSVDEEVKLRSWPATTVWLEWIKLWWDQLKDRVNKKRTIKRSELALEDW